MNAKEAAETTLKFCENIQKNPEYISQIQHVERLIDEAAKSGEWSVTYFNKNKQIQKYVGIHFQTLEQHPFKVSNLRDSICINWMP